MTTSEILDTVNESYKSKDELYRPASFWEASTKELVENYLAKISQLKPKWILLRNIRERKAVKKRRKFTWC